MAVAFDPARWEGNQWASIDIEPPAERYYQLFLPVLHHLAATYGFAMPTLCPMLDGYAADFSLRGSEATLFQDNWGMSLAFEHDAVRDEVLAHLQTLPADFFIR